LGLFGRKKENNEDIKKIKEHIQSQPMQPVSSPPPFPHMTPEPMPTSSFVIARRVIEQREKVTYSPSGQQIRTGETESVEMLNPIYDLSLDDLLDIAVSCRGTTIGNAIVKLMREKLG